MKTTTPRRQTWFAAALAAAIVTPATMTARAADDPAVVLEPGEGKVTVTLGGEPFAEFLYGEGRAKPVVYPLIGPGGVRMTRDYPFKETPGESDDHPHQESLWFTHGDVNGVSFWHLGDDAGRVVPESVKVEGDSVVAENRWLKPDGAPVCSDTTVVTFGAEGEVRTVDFTITIRATEGDVTFGDTKEGTMGIRTHPNLRLKNDPRRGVTTANGHAINSSGDTDGDLWGKNAAWVDYWGEIDGKTVGVAILDHPTNPRHPTTWHARDYGLVAANPFGLSDFQDKPKGAGDFTIKSGDTATWKYRFLLHPSDAQTANVGWHYETWAGE